MIDSIVLESKFSNLEQLNGFIKISNFLVSKISFDFYQTTNIYTRLIKSEIPFFQ